MNTAESLTENGCTITCGLKLGLDSLSSQDVEESTALEQKYNLVNQPITFLGSNSNSYENCTIKDKIEELRKKIGEYYFDKENKLIAIPNQIDLPKKPFILDPEETNTDKLNKNNAYIDEDCENKLHLEIIKIARKTNEHAFVMKGFNSGSCLKVEIDKGKSVRSGNKCKCKPKVECTCGKQKIKCTCIKPKYECTCGEAKKKCKCKPKFKCTCGKAENRCKCKAKVECKCSKPKYPELNKSEKILMEILEIEVIEKERLTRCTELFKNMKITKIENSKEMPHEPHSENEEINLNTKKQKVDFSEDNFFYKG